jgi:large subunit ribosomal protein L23
MARKRKKTVKKKPAKAAKKKAIQKKKDPWDILKYPYLTEKSMSLVERANTIVFIVNRKATKKQIRKAFEDIFEVKVDRVNTMITSGAEKKAFIKLKKEYKAADVAVKLGAI